MKNRSGRPPSACPRALLIAAMTVTMSGVPKVVVAQEIPVKLLEAGELKRSEVGPVPRERPRPPLEWRTIYRALTVVIPLEFECCRIPPQFTLSPREPYFARGNRFAALHLTTSDGSIEFNPSGYGLPLGDEFESYRGEGYVMLNSGALGVALFNLDPDSRYLVDFRVIGGDGRSWSLVGEYLDPVSATNGHVLVVVETDSRGNAFPLLAGERWAYVVDVTVSALGPIP